MFLPKKSKIFNNLAEQAEIITKAAKEFEKLTGDWENIRIHARKLNKLESKADELVHSITDDIEKYFILPMDKEDIKELTETTDDIIDGLEQTANRLLIYKMSNSNGSIKEFAKILRKSVEEVQKGILLIKENKFAKKQEFVTCYKGLHDLESEGDALYRKILEDLMSAGVLDFKERDTLTIIKWKEIFEDLEGILDLCEDIAIIFERLRIKYS